MRLEKRTSPIALALAAAGVLFAGCQAQKPAASNQHSENPSNSVDALIAQVDGYIASLRTQAYTLTMTVTDTNGRNLSFVGYKDATGRSTSTLTDSAQNVQLVTYADANQIVSIDNTSQRVDLVYLDNFQEVNTKDAALDSLTGASEIPAEINSSNATVTQDFSNNNVLTYNGVTTASGQTISGVVVFDHSGEFLSAAHSTIAPGASAPITTLLSNVRRTPSAPSFSAPAIPPSYAQHDNTAAVEEEIQNSL
jgi:hypothetical protein